MLQAMLQATKTNLKCGLCRLIISPYQMSFMFLSSSFRRHCQTPAKDWLLIGNKNAVEESLLQRQCMVQCVHRGVAPILMRHGICAVLSCCERTPLQHSELRPVAYFAKWPAPMPVLVWATLDKIVPRGSKRRLVLNQDSNSKRVWIFYTDATCKND